MNKILYIAPFLDGTGYSNAALNYLYAMDDVGIDVVPRHIKLNNNEVTLSDRYKSLAGKDSCGCGTVIQHTLPNQFVYDGNFHNIGMFATETTAISPDWVDHCNMMDEIIVFTENSKKACLDSGVTVPINVIPNCVDMNRYKDYERLHFNSIIDDTYKFYYIGELNRRKNIECLLEAYHSMFCAADNTQLIIKTTSAGFESVDQCVQTFKNISTHIKRGIGLFDRTEGYQDEVLIVDFWPDEQIMQLHETCDCFVSTSRGEAFQYPLVDALNMGNAAVFHDELKYVTTNSSWYSQSRLVMVTHGYPVYFGSWWEHDPAAVAIAMGNAFTSSPNQAKKKSLMQYSREVVGQQLKSILEK